MRAQIHGCGACLSWRIGKQCAANSVNTRLARFSLLFVAMMLRTLTLVVAVAIFVPATSLAQTQRTDTADPVSFNLQAPRIGIATSTIEGAWNFAGAVTLFTLAGRDDDDDWNFAGVYAGFGVAALFMSAWSFGHLAGSVKQLRRLRGGNYDLKRSMRYNRAAISYDTVKSISYSAAIIAAAVPDDYDSRDSILAMATTAGVMLALHTWSLALNGRQLRRSKQALARGEEFALQPRRRVALSGSGFRW